MSRPVFATILSATGAPREGLRVDFHATPPDVSVNAVTDAGGVFVAELVPGTAYMVPVMNAVTVEGQDFPAGMVFHRRDGGASTSLYVKTSGVGNTGWTGK